MDLRPYQIRAIDAVRRQIQQGSRSPLLVAPTGAGKTVIMAHVVKSAVSRGRRVVVCAHRMELIDQIVKALRGVGVECGIIAPWARPNPFPHVQVASVGTIARRGVMPHGDLLVIDEAHHVTPGNQWGDVVEGIGAKHVLGLTATPIRTDGHGLGVQAGGIFDSMEVVTTTRELVEAGYLARPVVYAPSVLPDLAGAKLHAGDYDQKSKSKAMRTARVTGDVIAHYKRICPGALAVAFCVSIDHAREVAADFQAAGIPADYLDGGRERSERQAVLAGLAAGKIKVLTSCDLIGEGFDLPAIEAAILLRPTISTGLYLQQVGRALRPAPGKERAIILDHAGNVLRHGMPTDERAWSLDEGEDVSTRRKADADAAPVWQCGKCYAYTPTAERVCEACGHERPFAGRVVEVEAGELAEVIEVKGRQVDTERKQAKTLEQLRQLAKERGYHPRWAEHVYKSRRMKG